MVARWMQAKQLKIKRHKAANRIKVPYRIDGKLTQELYGHTGSYGRIVSDADEPGGLRNVCMKLTDWQADLRGQGKTVWYANKVFSTNHEVLVMFFSANRAYFVYASSQLNVIKTSRMYNLDYARSLITNEMTAVARIIWNKWDALSSCS